MSHVPRPVFGFWIRFPPPLFQRPTDSQECLITWEEGEAADHFLYLGYRKQWYQPSSHTILTNPATAKVRGHCRVLPLLARAGPSVTTHPLLCGNDIIPRIERNTLHSKSVIGLIEEHLRPFVKEPDGCPHGESHYHTENTRPRVMCHHRSLILLTFQGKI